MRLAVLCAAALALAATEPAYVVRGHQVEAQQRELRQRIARFHTALTARLERDAPELLIALDPPPPAKVVSGYGILPRIVPDAPLKPPTKPDIVSFSWPWSETLLARQTATLVTLEAELTKGGSSSNGRKTRPMLKSLVTGYKTIVDGQRPIDADVDYNWLWQKAIATDRAQFDRTTKELDAIRERQLRNEPITAELAEQLGSAAPPDFVRIESSSGGEQAVSVRMYTDIDDAAFVETFKTAVEDAWHVRNGDTERRVRLSIIVVPPAQEKGSPVDVATHVGRFPKDGAILTTGAASTHVWGGRAIILGPHDIAPRTLAHEFGHVLGFQDAYIRGYRDIGADGYRIQELALDPTDVMSSPGTGIVHVRHFQQLIEAGEVRELMRAGLDALYQRNDPDEAAVRFREVLRRNAAHYGATLQLAKALDEAGKADEALPFWKRILQMAEAAHDADTTRVARARLSDRN